MKKLFALLIGMMAMFSLSAAGVANAETATTDITIEPQGKTYETQYTPANLTLAGDIFPADPPSTNPLGQPSLKPLLSTQYNLTNDQRFVPDPKQPVCTAVNENNASFPPSVAISMCPDSLVGNGTAQLLLGNAILPGNPNLLTDPILTVFNAGADSQGRGIMTIHGYSASTNVGIYMSGVLINGALNIEVPRLTADSATTTLSVSIPGEIGQVDDYFQSKCSSGSWTVNATDTLGYRDANNNISDQEVVDTPKQTIECEANAGKPKLKVKKVKAKGKVKANKKGTFKVTVKNSGSATAKKVKLTGAGAAKGSSGVGNLAPGKTKTYTKKFKVKGKKGKKVTVKVKAKGSNTNASTGKTKVKLK